MRTSSFLEDVTKALKRLAALSNKFLRFSVVRWGEPKPKLTFNRLQWKVARLSPSWKILNSSLQSIITFLIFSDLRKYCIQFSLQLKIKQVFGNLKSLMTSEDSPKISKKYKLTKENIASAITAQKWESHLCPLQLKSLVRNIGSFQKNTQAFGCVKWQPFFPSAGVVCSFL